MRASTCFLSLLMLLGVGAEAEARPLAKSYQGRWDSVLTPAGKRVRQIQLGRTRQGRGQYVLVRRGKEDFSLMVRNNRTQRMRPSRSKRAVTSARVATEMARAEAIRLYESSNISQAGNPMHRKVYGRLGKGGDVHLGATTYKTRYHGLSRDGKVHIVELNPSKVKSNSPKSRVADTRFLMVDTQLGAVSMSLTVPNRTSAKGHVIAHWLDYSLR